MLLYTGAETDRELQQVLDLQAKNLCHRLSKEEMVEQGFLMIEHDMPTLKAISGPYSHVIAKEGDKVAGFAMVMLREYRDALPLLVPMFDLLDDLEYQGKLLKEYNYVVLGQICVDKDYRGKGVFKGLYHAFREKMQQDFDLVVTEVATRNVRSLSAHKSTGFVPLTEYVSPENERWTVVVWDWRN